MKQLIFITMLFCLAASFAGAQDRTYTMTSTSTYYALPYRAADSVSSKSSDSTWYFQWLNESNYPVKTNAKVHLHETSGTGNCITVLRGKQFSGDSWTLIDTVAYSGAGSDTTFTITDATARQFRYFSVLLDKVYGTTGKVTVGSLEVKNWQTQ